MILDAPRESFHLNEKSIEIDSGMAEARLGLA